LKIITKRNKKAFLFLVLLNIIISYNPLYLYYLLNNGLLGGISLYISLSTISAGIALLYFLTLLRLENKFKLKTLISPVTFYTLFVFVGLILSILLGNDKNNILIDFFPAFQFLLGYALVVASDLKLSDIQKHRKLNRNIYFYINLVILTMILSYLYLTVVGHNFGVLKAHVSGITVGRLPDFIFPIFVVGILLYIKESNILVILLKAASLIYISMSMYRTVYLAVFLSILYMILIEKENVFKRTKILLTLIFITICVNLVIISSSDDLSKYSVYAEKTVERIGSIFEVEDRPEETSRTARFKQLYYFQNVIANPFGYGFGGVIYENEDRHEINPIPFYTMAFYPLQLMLSIGLIGGVLFIYLMFLTLYRIHILRKRCSSKYNYMGLGFIASGMIVIIIFLLLFPYVVYFPITLILGLMIGLINNEYNLYLSDKAHARK